MSETYLCLATHILTSLSASQLLSITSSQKKFFIKNYDITNLCVRLLCLVAIPKGKFEDDVIVVWIERLEIHGEDMILP
jgi:hypothetical protein